MIRLTVLIPLLFGGCALVELAVHNSNRAVLLDRAVDDEIELIRGQDGETTEDHEVDSSTQHHQGSDNVETDTKIDASLY